MRGPQYVVAVHCSGEGMAPAPHASSKQRSVSLVCEHSEQHLRQQQAVSVEKSSVSGTAGCGHLCGNGLTRVRRQRGSLLGETHANPGVSSTVQGFTTALHAMCEAPERVRVAERRDKAPKRVLCACALCMAGRWAQHKGCAMTSAWHTPWQHKRTNPVPGKYGPDRGSHGARRRHDAARSQRRGRQVASSGCTCVSVASPLASHAWVVVRGSSGRCLQ